MDWIIKIKLLKNNYFLHYAIKSFNDTLVVYEKKLENFGIPKSDLGFVKFDSDTSQMPTGLVSK